MIRSSIAVAAAVAVVLTGGTAAAAGPAGKKKTDLELSYQADAGYAAALKLRCGPPGGPHPKPAAACRTLTRVHGQPDKIKAAPTICLLVYAPITAEITGRWRGHKIAWKRTYGNKCEMNRATGVLFTF